MTANRNMVIDMATKRPVRRRDLPPENVLPLTPNAHHERRRSRMRKMSGWLRENRKPKTILKWISTTNTINWNTVTYKAEWRAW